MRPDPRYLLGISLLISSWPSSALASEPRCAISQNGQWSPQADVQSLENCAAALKLRSEQSTGVLFARWNENLIGYDGAVFYVSQNNGETWTPTALRTQSTLIASTNTEMQPEAPPATSAAAPAAVAPAAALPTESHPTASAPTAMASATPTAPPAAAQMEPAPAKPTPKAATKPAKPVSVQPAPASVTASTRPEPASDTEPMAAETLPSLASVLASLPEPAAAEPAAIAAAATSTKSEKTAAVAKPPVAPPQPAVTVAATQPAPPPAPPAPPKQLPGLPGAEGPAPRFPGLPASAETAAAADSKGTPCLIWNGNWIRSTAPDLRACANLLDQSPENYDEGGYKYAYWSRTYLVATRQSVKSLAADGESWADVRKRYRY